MTDAEHTAFLRGFDLARPPGPDEADALERAEEVLPARRGTVCVAVSKNLAKTFVAEIDSLPEHLAGAAWSGFLRGLVAKGGGAPFYIHDSGRA